MSETPARTLPSAYFTDPKQFEKEMERFYFGRWICAGRAERIPNPGDYFLCDVIGESIIVTRCSTVQCARSSTSAATAGRVCVPQ